MSLRKSFLLRYCQNRSIFNKPLSNITDETALIRFCQVVSLTIGRKLQGLSTDSDLDDWSGSVTASIRKSRFSIRYKQGTHCFNSKLNCYFIRHFPLWYERNIRAAKQCLFIYFYWLYWCQNTEKSTLNPVFTSHSLHY